jgi:hypothetical protein
MSVTINIATTDRSSDIDYKSIIYAQGLTKEPDTLEFSMLKKTGRSMPDLSDVVELYLGATKIFAGKIVEKDEQVVGGLLQRHVFRCKDYSFDLDRKLVAKSYENQTAEAIIDDIISTFTSGFTSTGVASGTPTISSIRFNYEPVSKCLQRIADIIGWDWYVDETKNIQFFDEVTNSAPYEIDDTQGNSVFSSLNFRRNILELRNSIYLVGGEYKFTYGAGDTPDIYEADGTQRVFSCIYKYSDVSVTVAGVAQTVGTDQLHDPADYDCLYNFAEKAVKFPDGTKPTSGQEVKIYGDAHIRLITQIKDHSSVTTYGEYQDLKNEPEIISIDEAFSFGKAQLLKWLDGSYEGSFRTSTTGWRTGQQVRINSDEFGIDKYFKINRIDARMRTPTEMEFVCYFIASGEIGFTDMMVGLLSQGKKLVVTDSQIIKRLQTFSEPINVVEGLTPVKSSGPYNWGPDANELVWGFGSWG